MKSSLFPIATMVFLCAHFLSAQTSETIIDRGRYTRSNAVEAFGDKFVVSNNISVPNAFRGLSPTKLILSIVNKDLKVVDSISFPQEGSNILELESIGDSVLAVALRIWPEDSTVAKNQVLFYDTNFNLMGAYSDQAPNSRAVVLIDIVPLGDSLVLNYVEFPVPRGANHKPYLELVSLRSKQNILTRTYHDSLLSIDSQGQSETAFTDIVRFKDGFLAMDREVSFSNDVISYQLNGKFEMEAYVRRSDSSLVSLLPRPISLPPLLDFGGDKFIKNRKGEVFLTGLLQEEHIGLLKLDSNLKGVRLDTFNMVRYLDDQSFNGYSRRLYPDEFKNNTDFITPDSIFFAVSMNRYNHFFIPFREEYKYTHQDIIVYNMDTAGHLNWRKRIAQDSVFFLAENIFATSDGGAVVFAGKMDLKKDMQPHEVISIIKLDRLGNVVNEREFTPPQPRWSVYPNPMRSRFTLTGLEENETVQMQLLNLNGEVMWEQTGRAGAYTLPPQLEKGFYLLQLSNEQGQNLGVRRVMVEGR